jgi:hypothetical protein
MGWIVVIAGAVLLLFLCCCSVQPDDGYNTAYSEFLRGERLAIVTEKDASQGISEMELWDCYYSDATFSDFQYALFDMNADNIPELHLRSTLTYAIFTYTNYELQLWYYSAGYEWPLDNSAILYTRPGGAPPHDTYQYKELDVQGNIIFHVIFEKYDINYDSLYDTHDAYFYEGSRISKEEWDALTEPYLSATSNLIEWTQLGNDFTEISWEY